MMMMMMMMGIMMVIMMICVKTILLKEISFAITSKIQKTVQVPMIHLSHSSLKNVRIKNIISVLF